MFHIQATGVSTEPIREAPARFLASLTPEQRDRTLFPVDDLEWRRWRVPSASLCPRVADGLMIVIVDRWSGEAYSASFWTDIAKRRLTPSIGKYSIGVQEMLSEDLCNDLKKQLHTITKNANTELVSRPDEWGRINFEKA